MERRVICLVLAVCLELMIMPSKAVAEAGIFLCIDKSNNVLQSIMEEIDPDLADAVAAIENADYLPTERGEERLIEDYIERIAREAFDAEFSIEINKISFTAPVDGTESIPEGIAGSFKFTITLGNGEQSVTTSELELDVIATPYAGVSDEQAVNAAMECVIDGKITVAFGASQDEKTEAVQLYVKSLLLGDACNVSFNVEFKGEHTYSILISKGCETATKTITMAITEENSPEISAAIIAAEGATYPDTSQAAHSTKDALIKYVMDIATKAIDDREIELIIEQVKFTPPVAGTADKSEGEKGSFDFVVTVTKGEQSQSTARICIIVIATEFSGGSVDGGGTSGGGIGGGIIVPMPEPEKPAAKPSVEFTDIENNWAKTDIEYVVREGLFLGTSNETFSPNIAMTRGMFITTLGRLAGADISKQANNSFNDVGAEAYYIGYIEWACKNDIALGYNGEFMPEAKVTREQMAIIIQNFLSFEGIKLHNSNEEYAFADEDEISDFAKSAVKEMQGAGILIGRSGNRFEPKGQATRAEVAALLRRLADFREAAKQGD